MTLIRSGRLTKTQKESQSDPTETQGLCCPCGWPGVGAGVDTCDRGRALKSRTHIPSGPSQGMRRINHLLATACDRGHITRLHVATSRIYLEEIAEEILGPLLTYVCVIVCCSRDSPCQTTQMVPLPSPRSSNRISFGLSPGKRQWRRQLWVVSL